MNGCHRGRRFRHTCGDPVCDLVGEQWDKNSHTEGGGKIPEQTVGSGARTGFLGRQSGQDHLHKDGAVSAQAETQHPQGCHQQQNRGGLGEQQQNSAADPGQQEGANQDPFRVEPVCQWAQQHSALVIGIIRSRLAEQCYA